MARSLGRLVTREDALALRPSPTRALVAAPHAEQVSIALLGKGTVGGALLGQLALQQEMLRRDHGLHLRLVGFADSSRSVCAPEGFALADAAARLARGDPHGGRSGERLLAGLRGLPAPVLVDCTAADGMGDLYREAFRRRVHVVTANKKPLTETRRGLDTLAGTAAAHGRSFCYETTVGASLPVIDTLQNLVRTGDRVRLVEGSLSGTLGYLTDELSRGVPLTRAVRVAHEKGYTEPEPQDDLSGMDVARKALILAREMGRAVELADIAVTPLVPAELLAPCSIVAFLDGLAGYEAVLAAEIAHERAAGRVLRYLARVTPGDGRLRVGPAYVDADHPAARLRGAESFVAFTTERHAHAPLVVQGAGAGGAVTAAGVLADVLRVARQRRGW